MSLFKIDTPKLIEAFEGLKKQFLAQSCGISSTPLRITAFTRDGIEPDKIIIEDGAHPVLEIDQFELTKSEFAHRYQGEIEHDDGGKTRLDNINLHLGEMHIAYNYEADKPNTADPYFTYAKVVKIEEGCEYSVRPAPSEPQPD